MKRSGMSKTFVIVSEHGFCRVYFVFSFLRDSKKSRYKYVATTLVITRAALPHWATVVINVVPGKCRGFEPAVGCVLVRVGMGCGLGGEACVLLGVFGANVPPTHSTGTQKHYTTRCTYTHTHLLIFPRYVPPRAMS